MIGALGDHWRATVDRVGNVEPHDGSAPLRWFVAAEDRWHRPSDDTAIRQTVLSGTPVVETRLRVPGGDVIQRLFVAPGRGTPTALVMEVENDSARAVAVAVTRTDVVAARTPTDPVISGRHVAELGLGAVPVVLPLGHRARVRVAIPCSPLGAVDPVGYLAGFPDWTDVVRGWTTLCERASRIAVPDLAEAVPVVDSMIAERCRAALDPPGEIHDGDSAIAGLLAWRDAIPMGLGRPEEEILVSAVEVLMRAVRRGRPWSRDAARAVEAAALLLGTGAKLERSKEQDSDLLGELQRVVASALQKPIEPLPRLLAAATGEARRWVDRLEDEMVRWSDHQEATLCPSGIASGRLGVDVEAHRIPVGPHHHLSFALRWHGAHPAVIWEVDGPSGFRLRSGVDAQWMTAKSSGEALWRIPDGIRPSASNSLSFS